MFTDVGLNVLRNYLTGYSTSAPSHMGLGKGTTAPAAGQTVLFDEVLPTTSRNVITINSGTYAVSASMFVATTELNGTTIAELGLFDSASGGDLIIRKTQPDLTKASVHEIVSFINMVVRSEVS